MKCGYKKQRGGEMTGKMKSGKKTINSPPKTEHLLPNYNFLKNDSSYPTVKKVKNTN